MVMIMIMMEIGVMVMSMGDRFMGMYMAMIAQNFTVRILQVQSLPL
jgi:hypothetical protein